MHTKGTQQYQSIAGELRAQLTVNHREVQKLQNELAAQQERNNGTHGPGQVDKMRNDIQACLSAVGETTREIERLQGDFSSNENIFK